MLWGIQPEVETLQMFIFPVTDCVPNTPRVLRGNPFQSGQCMCNRRLHNAGDLHPSPHVLWAGRALPCFIKRFAHPARPLYNVLGKEVKMGLVQLPPEVWEAVRILKTKIETAPALVFPDFDKPFLLETDASKEGLGAVLSQKQDDGCYHPITFGSCSLTPMEKNYHSSKLEFLTLKWSMTEHFK